MEKDTKRSAWIDEDVASVPRNMYGITKVAAEDLCELFYRSRGLPVTVLRTSRFFPVPDDSRERRTRYDDMNLSCSTVASTSRMRCRPTLQRFAAPETSASGATW